MDLVISCNAGGLIFMNSGDGSFVRNEAWGTANDAVQNDAILNARTPGLVLADYDGGAQLVSIPRSLALPWPHLSPGGHRHRWRSRRAVLRCVW